MLTISSWFGRLGNNILQIIRAIYFAEINGHTLVRFPKHSYLTESTIQLSSVNDSLANVSNNFFYLKDFGLSNPSIKHMKDIFQKYIADIFIIKKNDSIQEHDDINTLYIHFRGGDNFLPNNNNPLYVQPPLCYYTNIIGNYSKIKLICEDSSNPCIQELLKFKHVEYISGSLYEDLLLFMKAKHLCIGLGTFGLLLFFMNDTIEKLYIPDYYFQLLGHTNSDCGNTEIIRTTFPNYIKIGEWKNSESQRQFMLQYRDN
tara:strand:- start:561 stop:1337 length:777 start_codon:yes stop_codon:yes gene_type:complete